MVRDLQAATPQQQGILADNLEAGAYRAARQEAGVHVLQNDRQLEVGQDGLEVQAAQVAPASLGIASQHLLPGEEAGQRRDGG